jgi:alpha-tubulin suppressor-like RCC1 family protein
MGALGLGDTTLRVVPTRGRRGEPLDPHLGHSQSSLAMSDDGRLWAAGQNHSGHLGHPNTGNLLTFTPVADAGFQHVALGSTSLAAITADGTFWTAGTAGAG